MHRAILRAGTEQDTCGADGGANAQLCGGEALPGTGNERQKAEHRGCPSHRGERFRVDEDAGSDTGGDSDGEDDGCKHGPSKCKRRGTGISERFRKIGIAPSQNLRRFRREHLSNTANA